MQLIIIIRELNMNRYIAKTVRAYSKGKSAGLCIPRCVYSVHKVTLLEAVVSGYGWRE